MHAQKGFTLIEMMITIVVMSIILMIAIPSFSALITQNRLSGNVNEFVAATMMARSEAIKRGVPVEVCRSVGAETSGSNVCDASKTDWTSGWLVMVPASGTGAAAVPAVILSRQDAFPTSTSITGTDSTGTPVTAITYTGTGTPVMPGASFEITDNSKYPRMVCFDPSGRTRVLPNVTACP